MIWSLKQQEQVTEQFLEAYTQGNLQGLLLLLTKDVTFWSDGGGQVTATLKPLQGAMKVARFFLTIRRKWLMTSAAQVVEVNGQPSIVIMTEGYVQSVMNFEIVEGCIQSIYTMRNPEKLKQFIDSLHETPLNGRMPVNIKLFQLRITAS